MTSMELTVLLSPGFSESLWCWSVRVTQAASGRVEARWRTADLAHGERAHRTRARALPAWCIQVLRALESLDFATLPPAVTWTSIDDCGHLAVGLRLEGKWSEFTVPDAPEIWPDLPIATRVALDEIMAVLEPIARKLHES